LKSTLNRHFDVATVLEAIKERGEVVTKIAYGDWKRAGEHSRSMTQQAIQMVQRNLTPGGDKNGADINLALDALEMAFTRNHINAFVIVGGDSDFMALVEKLKQYDKKVMVVGGRSFTSTILQKNCHEFIAYENLIAAPQVTPRRPAERMRAAGPGDASLAKALPLVRRALKVLSDREVSPQLGLLKSTLLQLDSTFTERDYGASTFRDFIEKMAAAGYVHLKQVDRSLLVELKEGHMLDEQEVTPQPQAVPAPEPVPVPTMSDAQPAMPGAPLGFPTSAPTPEQAEEGVRALSDAFKNARNTPHWPMYLRNVKQYVKNAAPMYDERRYGFANFLEAVRAAGRAGLFRLERNRQGILRIFAGSQFPRQGPAVAEAVNGEAIAEPATEIVEAAPVLEAVVLPFPEEEAQSPAPHVEVEDDLDDSIGNRISDTPAKPPIRRRTSARPAPAASGRKKPVAPRKTTRKKPDHHS